MTQEIDPSTGLIQVARGGGAVARHCHLYSRPLRATSDGAELHDTSDQFSKYKKHKSDQSGVEGIPEIPRRPGPVSCHLEDHRWEQTAY